MVRPRNDLLLWVGSLLLKSAQHNPYLFDPARLEMKRDLLPLVAFSDEQ